MGLYLIWWSTLVNNKDKPIVAMNDNTVIILISIKNSMSESVLMLLFSATKLKNNTPRISDKLVSKITNSRIPELKDLTVGMAMALLITQNGSANIRLFLNVYPPIYWNKYANAKANTTIGTSATTIDFLIIGNLVLSTFNSNDPSNTISINPTVPKTGSSGFRLGTLILNTLHACCTSHPATSNNITEGILVKELVRSKI